MTERGLATRHIARISNTEEGVSIVGAAGGPVLSAIACFENRFKSTTFVARILNQSSETVYCAAYGETQDGIESLNPREFRIAPATFKDITIVAPRRRRRKIGRVLISMRASTIDYTIDARVPDWILPLPFKAAAGALVLAGVAALASLSSIHFGPFPTRVLPRTAIHVAYSAFGLGSLNYDVGNGSRSIASGRLPLGNGILSFDGSASPALETVRVSWDQLGHRRDVAAATIEVAAPPVSSLPPAIRSFSIDRASIRSGDSIGIHYDVASTGGHVALLSNAGVEMLFAPLNASGFSTIPAPLVTNATPFRVELLAMRGGQSTMSEAGITVLPRVSSSLINIANPIKSNDLIRIAAQPAIGGTPLPIEIMQHQYPMRLGLQNSTGAMISEIEVAPSQTAAQLDIPPVTKATTFFLIATVLASGGEQSLVIPVPVRPQ